MNTLTESKNLVAKLLANEDVNVVRAKVKTASFNIENRTLTLPLWKKMSQNVEDMLIGHEVGHALFTPLEYSKDEDIKTLHAYMNVIEDVRIEKLMKRQYPGMRSAFTAGYNELREMDFFGINKTDLSRLLLIDRINLYYKCGYNCGVRFTDEEMTLVRKVDQCKTVDDVKTLARELFGYSTEVEKPQMEEELQEALRIKMEIAMEESQEDDGDDYEEFDTEDQNMFSGDPGEADPDESESESTGGSPDFEDQEEDTLDDIDVGEPEEEKTEITDEDLAPVTQKNFDDRMQELTDEESEFNYYDFGFNTYSKDKDPLMGYKDLMGMMETSYSEYMHTEPQIYHNFKKENQRIINYLLKEFEMRKAATEYQRSFDSPTGILNPSKLATYKINSDIFKKITEVAEGQQHGMIMLVDWSGSMHNVIDDVLRQSIILATFCRQASIPFRVFAFSNGLDRSYDDRIQFDEETYKAEAQRTDVVNMREFTLFEFLSDKMTNREFHRMCEMLLDQPYRRCRKLSMYSTPLNESLVYMLDYIGKFMKNNTVEKMSLITLTDGEAHPVSFGLAGKRISSYSRDYVDGTFKRKAVRNYYTDPVTHRTYELTDDGSEQTQELLKIIKDRYGIKLIGFYIGGTGGRELNQMLRTNCQMDSYEAYSRVDEFRRVARKDGVALLPTKVRDKLYYVPTNKLRIEDEDLTVNSGMSVHQLAKSFGKHLKVQKTNRVLLNSFIGEIA